jgi:hypothetical protein
VSSKIWKRKQRKCFYSPLAIPGTDLLLQGPPFLLQGFPERGGIAYASSGRRNVRSRNLLYLLSDYFIYRALNP